MPAARPARFYMRRLADGSERAERTRSRSDGDRDQSMADFFGAGPALPTAANVRSMDAILGELLEELHLQEEDMLPEVLADLWRKAVGNALSSFSELVSVARQSASIRITHPAVRYELTRMKPQIIRALNKALGEGSVRTVRFING